VGEGEAAEGGGPLGVEQDEQAGDAVVGLDGVVVQQPASLLPAALCVQDPGRSCPSARGEFEGSEFLTEVKGHEGLL